jgi:hypothetical protein
MFSGAKNDNKFWDVQVSIANAAAKLPRPSLSRLHHDILEEIGQLPGTDLIDYFISLANIPKEEVDEYLSYIGISRKKLKKRETESEYTKVADKVACGVNPTVLKFRQTFLEQYSEQPSEKLIKYFLQRVQSNSHRHHLVNGDRQTQFDFAQNIAHGKNPTVLTLRKEYTKKFGEPPDDEMTCFFLKIIKDAQQHGHNKPNKKDFEEKINFAKSASNGVITTILQFRKAYENAYGESPSTEIIDVFIKHIPRKVQG